MIAASNPPSARDAKAPLVASTGASKPMAVDPAAPDLSTRLAAALSASYRIDGELGRGGMSRVFLATELRFRRRVVIKVLAPDLSAGLLLERFEREVQLAAGLQDPHIVPLLSAGDVDGLPYYTMPYVEGASLRARLDERLTSGATIPADDAIAILLDVARALAYAHARGIVHRDIKPENVLLAGDTAVVTDFGIAKALQHATSTRPPSDELAASTDATALTRLGMVLGTPSYMAPEQATGGEVDGRTDLYAWGVMAYELLGGVHPFASRTTVVQLLAAHIGETPVPLARVAPALPPSLVEIVTRCLAKDPGHRPDSANDVVTALRRASTDSVSGERRRPSVLRRRGMKVVTATVVVLGALALSGWLLLPQELRATVHTLFTRAPATLRVNRVVVATFRNETGDPKLDPLGALVADYLSEGLARLGSLQVVDAGTAAATDALIRRIPRILRSSEDRALGEETGAKVVVAGSYYLDGDSIRFRARILDAESGAIRTPLEPVAALASAPSAGITALSARLVAALRAASDEDATDLGRLSPPRSAAAYEAFRQGYQAFLRSDVDSAIITPLRRAMALDSTYGAPAVTLAYFAGERFSYALADSALAHARRIREHLLPTELAMLDMTEAFARGDMASAVEASRRTLIPQLIAQVATQARRPRLAISALTSTDPDRGLNLQLGFFYWVTLSESYAMIGERSRARQAGREGVRRVPMLSEMGHDLELSARWGDVTAVRAALDAKASYGMYELTRAVHATTLLRVLGGHDAEGRAIADAWTDRFLARVKVDTMPGWFIAPVAGLFAATDRWSAMLQILQVGEARAVADSVRGVDQPAGFMYYHRHLRLLRAVALAHTGHRAEAERYDAEFARTEGARWDRGRSTMARAVIAAHLGDADRAIELATRALAEGGLTWSPLPNNGTAGLAHDPLFLPLRNDPRFGALIGPDPADAR
jgi:serine/threonine protein kinase/TolB-like protein